MSLNNDKMKHVFIREDSENSQKSSGKNPTIFAARHPLADICENVSGKRILSTRKVHKSHAVVEVKQVKQSALNDKQTKVKYFKKSEKVTERRNSDEIVKTSDEVFVEGEDHYVNYLPQNNLLNACYPTSGRAKSEDIGGEANKPLPVFRISGPGSSNVEIKKPSQKVTLARKLSNRNRPKNEDFFYEYGLYDEVYFKDNYVYMFRTEKRFIFRKDMMVKCINEDYRRIIVNWLNYVQQILGCTEATFLKAVRIYDFVLLSTKPPSKLYLLAGIICLWITCKYMDIPYIQVPKLHALCNGRYGKQEFLAMEKDILKLLEFNLNFPEPSSFLFYYLNQENVQKDSKIRNSAMFLLEMFTLLLDFSSLPPSLLASIALYLVIVKNSLKFDSFLQFVDNNVLDEETFLKKCKEIEYCVEKLLECKSVSKEIVEKYSGEKKCSVALDFL